MLQFIINCSDSTNKKHNGLGAASLSQHPINLRGTKELEVFLILANHFLQSTSDKLWYISLQSKIISWDIQNTWIRAPNIISWGFRSWHFRSAQWIHLLLRSPQHIKFQYIELRSGSNSVVRITEHNRSLPVTAFCKNGQTKQIHLLRDNGRTPVL